MTQIVLKSTIGVDYVQHCGGDAVVVAAARVSTLGAASATGQEEAGLIGYLMKNRHGTPFEHGSLTVRVHAPIKVWREWHRHRVGWSYNEESGRYKQLDPVFYVPPPERPMIRPDHFKSSRPDFLAASDGQYRDIVRTLEEGYADSYRRYEELLALGADRGLARDVLGVGIYSACYCTANPRSIMHFLELRTRRDDAARPSRPLWEIANAAGQLEELFAKHWPITYKAWATNGRQSP